MSNKGKKLQKYIVCEVSGGIHDYDNTSCNIIANISKSGKMVKKFKGTCLDCKQGTVRRYYE